MKITLKDGSVKEYAESMSVLQFILGKLMNPYKRTACCLGLWTPQMTIQLELPFSHN